MSELDFMVWAKQITAYFKSDFGAMSLIVAIVVSAVGVVMDEEEI